MRITKTDYLEYSFCRKNFWLKKHKPELFVGIELSDFEKKIIEEGNAADVAARHLFPIGVLIESEGSQAITDTHILIADKTEVLFQATFANDDFFIRADILVYDAAQDGFELYEVKATNSVNEKEPGSHVQDLAFQKQVIESCGLKILKTGVIHLNKEYRKQGEIDYQELFVVEDISEKVDAVGDSVRERMDEMKMYINMPEQKGCDCIYRGRSNQCSSFAHSNPDVPEYSVHDLYKIGLSKKKLNSWIDEGRYTLAEVAEEQLNDRQQLQISTHFSGESFVDRKEIAERLGELQFPLYFFDYEGFVSAIPLFDGFGPYEHVPFQYSLHILEEDGGITHKEYIITELAEDITRKLADQLAQDMSREGTVVSWYSPYEKGRNNKLIELHPEYAGFLNAVNDGMFDLEKIFSQNLYSDPGFRGKTSIKNVLPVLVPELSYTGLSIKKGDQASERWEYMMTKDVGAEERAQITADLLEYCKMDTWAMVKIYQFLNTII